MTHDRTTRGFGQRTRLEAARETLLSAVDPLERTTSVPLAEVDARVLAEPVTATRAVPNELRAAMDGFAVRASDTVGASDRSPTRLRPADAVGPGAAERVHTGSALPDAADAVVMIEHVERTDEDIFVREAVAEGENVRPVGEDVAADQQLFDRGHRLQPADLGLLRAVGRDTVTVYDRPTVEVVPTGEELVRDDPGRGETVETNGLTISRYVRRWGGKPRYRDVVTDDAAAIRAAIERGCDADAVVTTGGSSVGERDIVPDVVAEIGSVLVHGVAVKPGYPVAMGMVDSTPVLLLPGYPVSCLVNAVQFLRPLVARLGHTSPGPHPTTRATLARKIPSEPGVRTFVRVRLDASGDPPEAVPVRAGGASVLSSVTLADGWVVVPEAREGIDAGTQVAVEHWGWSP